MKVKCINIKRPNRDNVYDSLTVGKEYLVFTIEINDPASSVAKFTGDFVVYRLIDDDGVVIPYPSKIFEITSGKLSPNWLYINYKDGIEILPELFAGEFFWDDFYNSEPYALEVFEKVKEQLYNEESIN